MVVAVGMGVENTSGVSEGLLVGTRKPFEPVGDSGFAIHETMEMLKTSITKRRAFI